MQESLSHPLGTQSVIDYAPQNTGIFEAIDYPFARPETSYLSDGELVHELSDNYDVFQKQADAMLSAKGLPLLNDRVAVIGYGANVGPYRFTEKMEAFSSDETRSELVTAPMLKVSLKDMAIVWHGTPGRKGTTFAELYDGEWANGQEAECFVQYLTKEQLATMHTTEGATYHVVPVTAETKDGHTVQSLAYVAGTSNVLLRNGNPIHVAVPGRSHNHDSAMLQREALAHMFRGIDFHGVESAEDLVGLFAQASDEDKTALVAEARAQLFEVKRSTTYSYQAPYYFGRLDFNSLKKFTNTLAHTPDVLVLPEISLGRLRKLGDVGLCAKQLQSEAGMDEEKALEQARKELDIMESLRDQVIKDIMARGGGKLIKKGKPSED